MTNIKDLTLSNIVTKHQQAVAVFEKYNLDFCCKGKRSLEDACNEKLLPLDIIINELQPIIDGNKPSQINFSEMTASKMISYILLHHHFYIRQASPTIINHLTKVANKHGERFPYMIDVLKIFVQMTQELEQHMKKEENILFPRIKELEALINASVAINISPGYIAGPVSVMENEHEAAGEMMAHIRTLTNNFTTPAGACTTFIIALQELKAFEQDLHQHVHLENYLLFPLANNNFGKAVTSQYN